MLDTLTKRRIDSCRDMLVGKVPDPKSQVEQITIALIYKFMDDMDAEAEELGGHRSFFAGEYAKYGWANLMSPRLGGQEVLNLYSEALATMPRNDVILANPPFMSPKGGIKPHKRFSVQSNRSEVLFVDYIAEHLTPNGRAGVIVPEGIIFQSGGAYKDLRKMLVTKHLVAVISLPSGIFQPYTGVKTSVLILDRRRAKENSQILFTEIKNIGFSLGVKRTKIDADDLPQSLADYRAFRDGNGINSEISFTIPKEKIAANGYILSAQRYRAIMPRDNVLPFLPLSELCTIEKGKSSSTKTLPGSFPLILTAETPGSSDHYDFAGDAVCVPLISSTGHGKASMKRIRYAAERFALADLMAAVRPVDQETLNTRFLFHILDHVKPALAGLMSGAANVSMKTSDLGTFEIPLPPLAVQQEIVAEIAGYQKVVDGARQVVESYKPRIDVRPEWPVVELGEVTSLSTGTTPDTSKADYYAGDVNFIKTGEITNNFITCTTTHLSNKAVADYGLKTFPVGTILMAMYGQGKTRGQVAYLDIPACTTQNAAAIVVCDRLLPLYLFFFLLGQYEDLRRHGIEGHISHLNLQYLKRFVIPVPDLETQRAIVAEIEAEQRLVHGNKELAERFEAKIKAAIGRVWGDLTPPQAATLP